MCMTPNLEQDGALFDTTSAPEHVLIPIEEPSPCASVYPGEAINKTPRQIVFETSELNDEIQDKIMISVA